MTKKLIKAKDEQCLEELVEICRRVRIKCLKIVAKIGSGHLGGSLSATELLVALYFKILRIDPENPTWNDRDRFILSKGHITPAYYTVLAMRGYFPLECLGTFDCVNSMLQGHPDMTKTPGVDMTTGSLGQGFSSALGMAIAGKLSNRSFKVFAMIGDGEFQEGQIWEVIMWAGSHKLNNFICIMDNNQLQLASWVKEGLSIDPIVPKWQAFGWHTIEVDGHNMEDVVRGLEQAYSYGEGPVVVIAHTLKGKGVSFMEGVVRWHSSAPDNEELLRALRELLTDEEETEE